MSVSGSGVSDFAYTTDGRAAGVVELSSATDPIGGHGVSVQYGAEPGAITHILTQSDNFITAQDDRQIITG